MAGGFWKTLGSTLLDAGAAYFQQVRLVNELKQLPAAEARERFLTYAQGLSAAARAGFTLTLASLANAEQNPEAKRFIEWLRALLANPNVTPSPTSAPSTPPPSAVARAHLAPTPSASPQQPKGAAPTSSAAKTTPSSSAELAAVEGMKKLLQEQLATGDVRGDRRAAFGRTLEKIEALLTAHNEGRLHADAIPERIRQVFDDIAPYLADPGAQSRLAHATPRMKRIDQYAGAMKVALGRELMSSPPEPTREALAQVLGDATRFQHDVADVKDDEGLAKLERDVLRPAARARHELSMARHALFASPLWDMTPATPHVNRVTFAGAADLRRTLHAVLSPMGLQVATSEPIKNYGQGRWDALNRFHVAVFDLRGASRVGELGASRPERARELTAAAYELGLAFALGKPVIIVGDADEQLPFDIDVAPIPCDGSPDDLERLTEAIDEAFYVPQRGSSRTSIADSLAFLAAYTSDHPKRAVFEGMGWLDPTLAKDPAGFVARTNQLLRELTTPPTMLRPAWPAVYPDPADRRCFHVMPFGPVWANPVRDAAREACKAKGLRYIRGDESAENRIVHAIWGELCQARTVLVDLTDGNLNVMIELGIAHAIGRPVLLVEQPGPTSLRPKNIEKERVLAYSSPAELTSLLIDRLPAT